MDLSALKRRVAAEVERHRSDLIAVAEEIHRNPELGRREFAASGLLCRHLSQAGYRVMTGIAGQPTAFHASAGTQGAPGVAFLAEYDALPELGHACGHNLIAAMALGAALGVRPILDDMGGRAVVVGTPDEEDAGGKIPLAAAGVFNDLTAALIVHPGSRNQVIMEALAAVGFEVRFRGRAAHAASEPYKGINALDALIHSFNGINALRQHLREDVRIHGIITKGGAAPNIVPDWTEGRFIVRAKDRGYLQEVREKVENCLKAGELATGASLEIEWQETFDDMRSNMTLARVFRANMESLGLETCDPAPGEGMGSTDMGNVSHVVPAVHPTIAIAGPEVPGHTREFAEAAVSKIGLEAMISGAKAMAMTAVDIWNDGRLREDLRREFDSVR